MAMPQNEADLARFVQGAIRLLPSNLPGSLGSGSGTNPTITTTDIAGGPPHSPANGDIWIATNVDGNGTCWQFQYNGKTTSSFPWEFIGGSSLVAGGNPNAVANTLTQVGASGFYYGSGMFVNIPRAGDYVVSGVVEIALNGGAGGTHFTAVFAGSTAFQGESMTSGSTANTGPAGPYPIRGISAGTAVGVCASAAQPASNKINDSSTSVTPIRVQ